MWRRHACREKANRFTDQNLKAEYLEMERQWMHLAGSYEFVESLEHFLLDTKRAKLAPMPAPYD